MGWPAWGLCARGLAAQHRRSLGVHAPCLRRADLRLPSRLRLQEAERLHQLRHAHVVALYGVALSGPQGVLITEYCSGRDLHSALQLRKANSNNRLFGW